MPLILNEFFKEVFDETYGLISFKFDIENKAVYLIKNDQSKKIGELSIDGMSNLVTFHKKEKTEGILRHPQPSWTAHKHLIDCGVIDFLEYSVDNTIYSIKRSIVPFHSLDVKEFMGELKYIIPLTHWERKIVEIKPPQSELRTLLSKKVASGWVDFFEREYNKPNLKTLLSRIKNARDKGSKILPSQNNVFEAFRITSLEKIRVVIIGQDPYPAQEHAHGLAFSSKSKRTPQSLQNIFNEIKSEYPNFKRVDNDLTDWALQGVFLLNSILTVTEGYPNSHANVGWEKFTAEAISLISKENRPMVWLLWGKSAVNLYTNVAYKNKKHLVLTAGHPSPLSVKLFKNCGHFEKCNLYLRENGLSEIKW